MSLQVVVDQDVCMGAGNCANAEPGSFTLDADSVAQAEPCADELDDARLVEVARACPSGAIELYDHDEQVDIFSFQP